MQRGNSLYVGAASLIIVSVSVNVFVSVSVNVERDYPLGSSSPVPGSRGS